MRRLRRAGLPVLGVAFICVFCAGWDGARAQDEVEEVDGVVAIGVVDLQKIMRESIAAQKARDEIEAKQTAYRDQIGAREKELRAQQKELERQRTVLSAEAYDAREKEFLKQVEALQREVAERNRQIEESLAYARSQVQGRALQIIAHIADQKKLGLVLDKSQLLLVAKGLEFSEQALEQLNAELTSVATTPPPPADEN
jgi:outer membrane protein